MVSQHTRTLASGQTAYRAVLRINGRQKVVTLDTQLGADQLVACARAVADAAALAIL